MLLVPIAMACRMLGLQQSGSKSAYWLRAEVKLAGSTAGVHTQTQTIQERDCMMVGCSQVMLTHQHCWKLLNDNSTKAVTAAVESACQPSTGPTFQL